MQENENLKQEEEVRENPETEENPETAEAPAEEKNPLQEQLDAANAKTAEYLAMAQRVQADFENFRRRNEMAAAMGPRKCFRRWIIWNGRWTLRRLRRMRR